MTARDSQVFALPDGRVLGYAEYGHPEGSPLLFFHGFPSSRLEGRGIDAIARRRRLRVIAPDLPGFGLSTFQPNRRIVDWPADVRALADHIKLKRFAILGGSGGGPYALACAHALPREKLSGLGVISGAPPWQAGSHMMPWFAKATYAAAWYLPSGLRLTTSALVNVLKWAATTGPVTRWLDGFLEQLKQKREKEGQLPVEGEENSTAEERRARLIQIAFEGFAQGAEGFVYETQLLTQDWGFRFEDVTYEKIRIWHGVQDKNAPIEMMRYMAERLPHAELKEYEGEDHFAISQHLEEILDELVPNGASDKAAADQNEVK